MDLAAFDVVLMRQDPPFDLAYITATHLLEHIHPGTLVVNDPVSVRNAPEKLFATHFPELMPPTLITNRADDIHAFRREHRDIIVKPLHGNGGAGVFHLRPGDENLNSLLEMFGQLWREPLMVQRYLPEVQEGDKRIILVDGAAAGAVARMPAAGEARANFHAGGTARKTALTARDREICEALGPVLRRAGARLRRDRRHRRLADGDQRDLADRHPGDRPPGRHLHRGRHLGRDRAPARGEHRLNAHGPARPVSARRGPAGRRSAGLPPAIPGPLLPRPALRPATRSGVFAALRIPSVLTVDDIRAALERRRPSRRGAPVHSGMAERFRRDGARR